MIQFNEADLQGQGGEGPRKDLGGRRANKIIITEGRCLCFVDDLYN